MTQEAIQITETPPLPGLKLVQDLNKALLTLGTDFAGPDDPAALAAPFMTWADTGNMLLKRRNEANSAWVTVGALLSYGSPSLTFKAAPSVAADDAVVRSESFGIGQTWKASTLTANVSRVNTSGKMIKFRVTATLSVANGAGSPYIEVTQGGATRRLFGSTAYDLVGSAATVEAEVPNGASYLFFNTGSAMAVASASELS